LSEVVAIGEHDYKAHEHYAHAPVDYADAMQNYGFYWSSSGTYG
jgi:hypothetical protein